MQRLPLAQGNICICFCVLEYFFQWPGLAQVLRNLLGDVRVVPQEVSNNLNRRFALCP